MEIRLATLADLNACLALDDSFETEYVWQMEERREARQIAVNLRLTRLPRPMKVRNAVSRDDLVADYQRGENLWVYDEDGGIVGFISAVAEEWNQSASIHNLAVAPAYRRKGIGSLLMRTVLDWARQKQLRVVLLDTSTKNYPAICFYQKHGFTFCGFNDQLYPNRDIALLFALNLRHI
jgi:ribosomal protein S18 acetylase RimI-like enzyme